MKTAISNNILRPENFDQYLGQKKAAGRMKVALQASRMRGEQLGHILLSGPPGLGKTTLAGIVAKESGGRLKHYTGPAIQKADDMIGIIEDMQEGDILFVDEIHALSPTIEEVFLTMMEDGIGFIPASDGFPSSKFEIPNFTLIGATTRAGKISRPLRDRFGIRLQLEYYSVEELVEIVMQAGDKMDMTINREAALEVAKRSRDTPRIANHLLCRIRDYSQVFHNNITTKEVAEEALEMEEVDSIGLTPLDREYLRIMYTVYNERPVGIKAMAATMREDVENLEDVVEPYLLKLGFVARTPKGRWLTESGREYASKNT